MKSALQTPRSPRLSHRLGIFVIVTCYALVLSPLRNVLQAADEQFEYTNSVAAADSQYRTFYDPAVSPGKSTGWKPYNRWSWFQGQRAFPSGTIPVEARFNAWQEAQQHRDGSSLDENWVQIGPTNIAGRMLCIEWHPTNANIIYAGAASGGLWKTTNGGTSWFPLTDELPSISVGSLVLDPTNPEIVYIGTGEGSFNIDAVYGAGVFKSTDGGTTWNTTGLSWTQSQSRAINKLVIDPDNTQILYAASNRVSGGGVYRTTNGGTSWTQYHAGDVKDIVMHPDSSNVLYCAVGYPWGHSENGIFKSINSGVTWTRLSTGLPAATSCGRIQLAISPSSPSNVYAGISTTISSYSQLYGIYKSTNGGSSWSTQATTPNMYAQQGWYNIVIAVHPTNPAIVYSAGLDCYKSTDNGVNWTRKSIWSYPPGHSQYCHADHHAFCFKPGDPNTVIAGTDGGLYKSTNGGDTWSDLNGGLATMQFYAMDNDALLPNVAYGGTQDNGTNKYNNSPTWSWVLSGDGGYCNVDFTNSNIVYAETQRGSHYKSTNAGGSFSYIGSTISGEGAWVTPVEMDPTNANILYTATRRIWKTVNGGSSWTVISPDTNSNYISTIAVAQSNPSVIYYGYEYNGQVWRTTNGGTSWSNVSTGLPYRYITRVAVHPTDANTVYATVSGYGTGHVWKTTNGGTSWTNVSTGIPDVPCNDVVLDRNTPTRMWVGTDLGVYHSTDGGTSWADYSTNLPNVVIDDLALHPTSGVLRAATHGRGMWETSTGVASLLVVSPNGGESWTVGSAQTITWGTGGIGGTVRIELNRDYPAGSWETLSASTANDGSHSWTVTTPTTSTARIRITSIESPAATDISNANFSITQPTITVISPNGGETAQFASTFNVQWSLVGGSGNVVIELNRWYPAGSWESIATTNGSTGTYGWYVVGSLTPQARIRIYLQSNPSIGDTSNANFQIVQPSITLAYPNGGEIWSPGQSAVIRWSSQYLQGTVRVELNRSYPGGAWSSLNAAVTGDSLVWTVDQTPASAARVRVISNFMGTIGDTSASNFTILTPSLAVTSPNGGELWSVGEQRTMRWNRSGFAGPVNVQLNRTYPGGGWTTIATNVSVDTLSWAVVTPYSNTARIRVVSVNLPTYYDDSNADFTIGTALELTAPVGGESWSAGTGYNVTWNRFNAAGNVTVELNRSYPAGSWETLTTTASGNALAWTATGPATTTARMRVFLTSTPSLGDTSTNNFTINAVGLALTYPVGGENFTVGTSQTITWTRNNANGNVTVQVNRDYPAGSWSSLTTTVSGNTYNWSVTGPASTTARVRIFLTATPGVGDTCNSNFNIIQPALLLSAPNGGESWSIGSQQTVRWSRMSASGNVTVQLKRTYPSGAWENLTTLAAADSFVWTVSGAATSTARMRIYLTSNSSVGDTSNANFSLISASIVVTAPNGGESWVLGLPYNITFTRTNADGPATIELNRSYPGGAWETLANDVSASSYSWTAAGAASTTTRVRVFLNATPSLRDSSNANFSLVTPSLTVTAPNGGESWNAGTVHNITFTRSNVSGGVTLALNRDYPSGSWETLTSNETGSSYSWTVTSPLTGTARIRATWNSLPSVTDESNANFSITAASLTLTTPNGGESYTVGAPITTRWTRNGVSGNVTVQLNRGYPAGAWETLTTTASADSFVWSSNGTASTSCRVRVRSTADSTISDFSAANFSLIQRDIEITTPNGGDTLYTGTSHTITFVRTNTTGSVTIQVNRNYPAGAWETLTSTLTTSSYNWSVNGATSTNCRVRIYWNTENFVADTSASNFRISAPSLVLNVPNGGEVWSTGQSNTVSWTKYGFSDNVRLELNRTYPGGVWEVISTSLSGSSYNWTTTGPATALARMRVISTANSSLRDSSNANFQIILPQITLVAPNGGETVNLGIPTTVRFTRSNAAGSAQVQLKRNYPSGAWENIGATTADSLVWTPSGATSSSSRVRVYLISDSGVGDTSASNFTLSQPALALNTPNGGENWLRNMTQTINWTRTGLTGGVRVELNTNYPSGGWTVLASGQTGNSYNWLITQSTTADARVRVIHEAYPQFGDSSNSDFSIVAPALSLTSPDGNEQWNIGSQYNITFTRSDHPGSLTVQLNRQYPGAVWETLATGVTTNSVGWIASGPATLNARMRIVSEVYTTPPVGDTSAASFRILSPGITLLSPDGGDVLTVGAQEWLRWARVGVGNVDVLLNRQYPTGSWESLYSNVNSDSVLWTVTGPASISCRVKVRATADHNVNDQSAGNFQIFHPQIEIIAPDTGDSLAIGVENLIAWQRTALDGNVRVDLNRTYPGGAWTTLGTTSGDEFYWIGTGPATSSARIRVVSLELPWVGDTLNQNLAILNRTLIFSNDLQSADSILAGDEFTLSWSRVNLGPGVNVFFSRQDPADSWELLAANVTADQWTWNVTGPHSSSARFRIVSIHHSGLGDTSAAHVILEPAIYLSEFAENVLGIGNGYSVNWIRSDAPGPVTLEVNYDYPTASWETIASGITGNSYEWTATGPVCEAARIRATVVGPGVTDVMTSSFALALPALTVVYPNGGELFDPDEIVPIAWSRFAVPGNVRVELNRDYPGGNWEILSNGIPGNSMNWMVPNEDFSHGRIRVSMANRAEIADVSNTDFGTQLPNLYLINPNGGDTLITGTSLTVRWGRVNAPGLARLELNRDYPGGSWEQIGIATSADSVVWTVNTPASGNARFRVSLAFEPEVNDVCDENVFIFQPALILLGPIAGDSIGIGDTLDFAWSRIGVGGHVNIQVKTNWPSGTWSTIGSGLFGNSWSWVASGNASESARFRVVSGSNSSISDTTNGAVRIGYQQLSFSDPLAADTFRAGDTLHVSWQRRFAPGPYRVEISFNGTGGPWQEIGTTPNLQMDWVIDGQATNTMRVRVSRASMSWVSGMTPFNCLIVEPSLSLLQPLPGRPMTIGRNLVIRWQRHFVTEPVDVYIDRSPVATLSLIRENVTGDSIHWIVEGPPSQSAQIRLQTASGLYVATESEGGYEMGEADVSLVSPVGGESYLAGEVVTVGWHRANNLDTVSIDLNRDFPSGAWESIATGIEDSTFTWTVTGPTTTTARMRVVSENDSAIGDTTGDAISVLVSGLALHDPQPGERVPIGFVRGLNWTRTAVEGPVILYLSRDGGTNFELISSGIEGEHFDWIPQGAATTSAMLRIVSSANPALASVSPLFVLATPTVSVVTPNGGEQFAIGMPMIVRWSESDHPAGVNVKLNRTWPSGSWETIGENVQGDSLNWPVTGAASSNARIRVESIQSANWFDESEGDFILIVPSIDLVAPLPEAELIAGDLLTVSWLRLATSAPVRVLLRRNASTDTLGVGLIGTSLQTLVPETPNESSWIVLETESGLLLSDSVHVQGPFIPAITMTAPLSGDRWVSGEEEVISWSRYHLSGGVRVELQRNYPDGAWETIALAEVDSVVWNVSGPETERLAVRATSLVRPTVASTVESIRVVVPTLTLEPLSQSSYRVGSELSLAWQDHEVDGEVRVELNRDYPAGEWESLGATEETHFDWIIAGASTNHARFRIASLLHPHVSDEGDEDIEFYIPEIHLEFIPDVDTVIIGSNLSFRLATEGEQHLTDIALQRTPGGAWETLLSGVAAGDYEWSVSGPPASTALLRAIAQGDSALGDTTHVFAIVPPPAELEFVSPTEVATDTSGSTLQLAWQWTNGSGAVRLERSVTGPAGPWESVSEAVSDTQYQYLVTGPETDSLCFRITGIEHPEALAVSVTRRVVVPSIEILVDEAPWYIGQSRWIQWTARHYEGPVAVELSRADRAEPWEELSASVTDSFLWVVSGPASDFAALRLRAVNREGVTDTTDAPLRIVAPRLTVVAPNGDEVLDLGSEIRLRWIGEGFAGAIGLALWRGAPVNRLDTLFLATENDSSESWLVNGPAAIGCYLIAISVDNPLIGDTSDSPFEIRALAAKQPIDLPTAFDLDYPYPNPFNATTVIPFALPRSARVEIAVYDVLGREVAMLLSEEVAAGRHEIAWQAHDVSTGMYFIQMLTGSHVFTRKVQVMK